MATWIQDEITPAKRGWEEFYRNRWQYDKIVRSTHGNNCTGGCAWMVHVKDGIITWELQAVDYEPLDPSVPPYEPRGCQRGISASWYVYSPVRIKYPYVRGTLIDAWKEAKSKHPDPVDAWASVVENSELHKKIKWSRGKGGFRRFDWDTAAEIITAAQIYTIKKYGPDRNISFSPIPAMSMISYCSGARYHQMIGGVSLSFYDYYTDLPCAHPQIWGEQTDVSEGADWYHSSYAVVVGGTPNRTRTADCHFFSELRIGGGKLVVITPDYSEAAKYADLWVPVKPGSDSALWVAINHVILKEFYVDRQVPYFVEYSKAYTDLPHLMKLRKTKNGYEMGRFLRAMDLKDYADTDNPEWKFAMWDTKTNKPRIVYGGMGFRYPKKKESEGKWNTLIKDEKTGETFDPALSFLSIKDEAKECVFYELDTGEAYKRQVPVKYIETVTEGKIPVATVFDMQMSHLGVARPGLSGDFVKGYDDDKGFSPAWQEKYTGIGRATVIQIAREFASNAEVTKGRSMVFSGASANHYAHSDLIYRGFIGALMLCGCIGRNGGGQNHYVGQEKLAPVDSWNQVAAGLDWQRPPRLQNTPSYWYINTQQWKYDDKITEYQKISPSAVLDYEHCADWQVRAVRLGGLPWYPQFNKNPLVVAEDAQRAGAKTDADIVDYTLKQLKGGGLQFSIEDPDAPENWPRVWMIWRGNALATSARGEEYFLKFLLGTHHNVDCEEVAKPHVKEMKFRESPLGKLDLVVDLNMRMNTTPTYSDIVLPAAHWYEKEDLNTTDLHSYLIPLGAAVPPNWEAKSDWDAFRFIAKKFSELAAKHLPKPVKDVVMTPLQHDSPGEITQPAMPDVQDWKKGECEAIPGVTMPNINVITRDYPNVYNRWRSFGPLMKNSKYGFHGIMMEGKPFYDEYMGSIHTPKVEWGGEKYISLMDARDACNVVLFFSSVTNGEACYQSWLVEEHHTGLHGATYKEAKESVKKIYGHDPSRVWTLKHADLHPRAWDAPKTEYHGMADEMAGADRNYRQTYNDVQAQPRRYLSSPIWSGDTRNGRTYIGYTNNIDFRMPWRTITGRQHFYLDHPTYLKFGEGLSTSKYKLDPHKMNETKRSDKSGALHLNYITPHGKWQIHSTHYDNLRMLTLSRGGNSIWVNDKDAESGGIKDNDWVEAYNDNGVYCARAVVSARIPSGTCFAYHAQERTINVPLSQIRNKIRGGFHNSLTRQRTKLPTLSVAGYGQFSYGFNAWGPTPIIRDTTILLRKMKNQEVTW